MRSSFAIILGVFMTLGSGFSMAGDPAAGKAKSQICVGCHGVNGVSAIPTYPNLAGQKEQYLVASMKAYRDGQRNNPIMSPMAKPLSDTDIANLAAYYASMSCQ